MDTKHAIPRVSRRLGTSTSICRKSIASRSIIKSRVLAFHDAHAAHEEMICVSWNRHWSKFGNNCVSSKNNFISIPRIDVLNSTKEYKNLSAMDESLPFRKYTIQSDRNLGNSTIRNWSTQIEKWYIEVISEQDRNKSKPLGIMSREQNEKTLFPTYNRCLDKTQTLILWTERCLLKVNPGSESERNYGFLAICFNLRLNG